MTTIREYREADDLPAVRQCFVELQEFERSLDARLPEGRTIVDVYLEGLFRRCAEFDGRLFVATVENQVTGYVCVLGACQSREPEDDPAPFAYVDDLVVLPGYRGRGHGRALLKRAEQYALECGRTSIRLRVKGENQPARALYTESGYTEYELELEKRLTD